jgi:glycosyltransferase involved in cell wall biosynthesis
MPRISDEPSPAGAVAASDPVFINGRFLTQPFSGVQRFAVEITSALGWAYAAAGQPAPVVLSPPSVERAPRGHPLVTAGLPLRFSTVGRRGGQAWEQAELPAHARRGRLLNLGNTAPLRVRRQAVIIHDAGVFRRPEAYSWRFRAWYKFLHKRLVRGSARIVTVSNFSRDEIVRYLGAHPASIDVIAEGADHMERLTSDHGILQRHGLRPRCYALAVGNLAAHKNLIGLRDTAEAVAARDCDLVIAGGIDQSVFASQQRAVPMPAKYIGRVSDQELRALYESAACFVFPSFYEGFGLPAVEAMICGCPVVAADIPALRELCGDAALYCDPFAPSDIAEKVVFLLDHRDAADRLRSDGQARVADYTWAAAAQSLKEILDRL